MGLRQERSRAMWFLLWAGTLVIPACSRPPELLTADVVVVVAGRSDRTPVAFPATTIHTPSASSSDAGWFDDDPQYLAAISAARDPDLYRLADVDLSVAASADHENGL